MAASTNASAGGAGGNLLRGDLGQVLPAVADLIKHRAYDRVSCEVYDYPPEGMPRDEVLALLRKRGLDPQRELAAARERAPGRKAQLDAERAAVAERQGRQPPPPLPLEWVVDEELRRPLGKALRRVALLGGELPQLKNLAELPLPKAGRDGLATLEDVELFAPGNPRGKPYTPKDLADMARNLEDHRHLYLPPIVIGHEEQQALAEGLPGMDNTGIPKVGRVESLRAGSAGSRGGSGRTQLVGGTAVYSESTWSGETYIPGRWTCFSEVARGGSTVDRQALLAQLADMGIDTTALQDPSQCSDAALQAIVSALGVGAPDETGMPAGGNEKTMMACRKYADAYAAKFRKHAEGEGSGEGDPSKKDMATAAAAQFSERLLTAAVAQVKKELGFSQQEITRFAEERTTRRRESLETTCAQLVKDGKVSAAEMDRSRGPNLVDRLLSLDDSQPVFKFSEGGKTIEKTQLQAELDALHARRPGTFKMGEKIRGGSAGGSAGSNSNHDIEIDRVERFSESAEMRDALKVIGRKPTEYVRDFREGLKVHPDMTAEQYGVPKEFV